eukprot:jgi/Tetstr1/436309/TSEL_025148.t1
MASTSVDKSHCFDAGNYTTSAAFLGQAGTERDEDFGSIGTAAGFTDSRVSADSGASASSASKPWKPKKPPKYKGRFYPVIGGKEGNCLYKKKKHAIKQMKGLPNASMKAFNLYEKAKEWLDGQLGVNVEWMTPKELFMHKRE